MHASTAHRRCTRPAFTATPLPAASHAASRIHTSLRALCPQHASSRQALSPRTSRSSTLHAPRQPRCEGTAAAAAAAANKATTPPTCAAGDVDGHTHGLRVRRDELQDGTKQGRAARLKRWATLGELEATSEVGGDGAGDEAGRAVRVWIVAQASKSDYKIVGKATTTVRRCCDRCTGAFDEACDGRFELLLDGTSSAGRDGDGADGGGGGDGGMEDVDAEAVVAFPQGVDVVDLSEHVRDAVLLGVPTRALCGAACEGVAVDGVDGVSVRYGAPGASERESASLGEDDSLRELKRRLEGSGQ